ncbi:glycosyltransferase [Vibrio sp. S/42/10]|uniref:glycosyltransferase n=1 Tax=Vibrio sp. S/42/10 TaxID=2914757 RepID=UPI00246950B0|nr:glycosyltransferase [Vibrio sp. S/42/10]MDH5881663.1 glycosyltransferase [Vibrio sp. S/42/10]
MNKKIALVTMQFPCSSETFASNDVRKMIESGRDVSVFTLKRKSKDHEKMLIERNLESVSINEVSYRKILLDFFLSPENIFKYIYLLRYCLVELFRFNFISFIKLTLLIPHSVYQYKRIVSYSPDVLHAFWGHFPSMILLLSKKYTPNIKTSIFLGAYDLSQKLYCSECGCKVSDFILTHSQGNKKRILDWLNVEQSRVEVAYRGVDIEKLNNNVISYEIKSNFITASRLIKSKRVDLVIDAFFFMTKNNDNTRLIIAGDGPERLSLEKKCRKLGIENLVDFVGHINQTTLFKLISESRALFLLSQSDGERLPNIVKEAMYLNTCVIVSRSKDIEELVEDRITGFIADDTINAVKEFIAMDKNREAEMLLNARNKIIRDFNLENSINTTFDFWDK